MFVIFMLGLKIILSKDKIGGGFKNIVSVCPAFPSPGTFNPLLPLRHISPDPHT